MKVFEIRLGINKNIIIQDVETGELISVEDDFLMVYIKDVYHIRYSSKWYAFKIMLGYIFNRNRKVSFKIEDSLNLEKYALPIFYGLEELGIVDRNDFYYKHIDILGMHPGEPVWMGKELVELNRHKFIKYLTKNKQKTK